jgi:hypothetical protein
VYLLLFLGEGHVPPDVKRVAPGPKHAAKEDAYGRGRVEQ